LPRVFISYSRTDREFVERLAADLEKNEITAWIDRTDMRVGDTIADTIHQAIRSADFLIAVISRSSLESKWVRDEHRVGAYVDVEKDGAFFLPALIEDVPLPPDLAYRQYADFREDYDRGLHDLLTRLAKTPPPLPPPKRSRLLLYVAASIGALLIAGAIWMATHPRPKPDPVSPDVGMKTVAPAELPPQRGRWIYIGTYFGAERRWTQRQLDISATALPQSLRCTESVIAAATGKVNVRSLPGPTQESVAEIDPGAPVKLLEIRDVGNGAQWARIAPDVPDVTLTGEVLDFSDADIQKTDTAPAAPFLHNHGIRVDGVEPTGSWLEIGTPLAFYRGEALHENRNVLTQTAKRPVAVYFTLAFAEPLAAVGITRAALYPHSVSGVTHPMWSAHAFDAAGGEIAAVGEPFLAEHCDIPARTFVLESANARIVSVRFNGDLRRSVGGGAAFHNVLIDELILKH
jgi:hypothetical protein